MKKVKVEYVGKDLEAMDLAENYHQWILQEMRPFLGSHIVEVGAGTGGFSRLLLATKPKSLALIEPSAMFESLETGVAGHNGSTAIRYFNNIFREVASEIGSGQPPDTIIYVNVLEHIEDDIGELRTILETLGPGGKLCLFVPAQPFLFSDFDRHIGHFRRYRKSDLEKKCREADFTIVRSRNFDLIGVVPWLIKYRWLRSLTMESGLVKLYDSLVVPVQRRIESIIPPLIGKNLLLIAEKRG